MENGKLQLKQHRIDARLLPKERKNEKARAESFFTPRFHILCSSMFLLDFDTLYTCLPYSYTIPIS